MKKKIALVLFCFIILDFFSQEVEAIESNYNETQQEDQIYTAVDESPEFPGGSKEMFSFLAKNMHYPIAAIENEIEGKNYVRFVVDKLGNIMNVEIARGIAGCPECDQESLRIVRAMPKWKPAMIAGKPVSSLFHLPITFSLK
jgi:protein TonB